MKEPAENKMHIGEPGPELVEPTVDELRETGNGPTVSYEETLLTQYFGPVDEYGRYGYRYPEVDDES